MLWQHGAIKSDRPIHQARELTRIISRKARVAFVTCASIRGNALHHGENVPTGDGGIENRMVSFHATSCIIDEAGCANPLQVLSAAEMFAVTLERLVLAGDHLQLAAVVSRSPRGYSEASL